MDQDQLQPLADHLMAAYLDIPDYSTWFVESHRFPPTRATKLHHMLSVMQSRILLDSDRYELGGSYSEFGRCQMLDRQHDRVYLLRSEVRIGIERAQPTSLFAAPQYIASPVVLLAYKFHADGLDLSVAGSQHRVGKFKLEASGKPNFIATYPFPTTAGTPGATTFDQGEVDHFNEIGEIDDREGEA